MRKTNLIGSFGSLEQAQKQISERFFYSNIHFEQSASCVWEIHNSKGHIKGFQLVKSKNRFRFILIEESEK